MLSGIRPAGISQQWHFCKQLSLSDGGWKSTKLVLFLEISFRTLRCLKRHLIQSQSLAEFPITFHREGYGYFLNYLTWNLKVITLFSLILTMLVKCCYSIPWNTPRSPFSFISKPSTDTKSVRHMRFKIWNQVRWFLTTIHCAEHWITVAFVVCTTTL